MTMTHWVGRICICVLVCCQIVRFARLPRAVDARLFNMPDCYNMFFQIARFLMAATFVRKCQIDLFARLSDYGIRQNDANPIGQFYIFGICHFW